MKGTTYVAFSLVSLSAAFLAQAQIAAQTKSARRTHTAAEYDAYQAAEAEQDANKRVRLIDDFILNIQNRHFSFTRIHCAIKRILY
jgi:hypothetical protein